MSAPVLCWICGLEVTNGCLHWDARFREIFTEPVIAIGVTVTEHLTAAPAQWLESDGMVVGDDRP